MFYYQLRIYFSKKYKSKVTTMKVKIFFVMPIVLDILLEFNELFHNITSHAFQVE